MYWREYHDPVRQAENQLEVAQKRGDTLAEEKASEDLHIAQERRSCAMKTLAAGGIGVGVGLATGASPLFSRARSSQCGGRCKTVLVCFEAIAKETFNAF